MNWTWPVPDQPPRRRRPQPKQISAKRTRLRRAEQQDRARRARRLLTRFWEDDGGNQDG